MLTNFVTKNPEPEEKKAWIGFFFGLESLVQSFVESESPILLVIYCIIFPFKMSHRYFGHCSHDF